MTAAELRNETLRYLGVQEKSPDGELLLLVDQAIERVEAAANTQFVSDCVACRAESGGVFIASHFIKSEALARHLATCETAILFASTLGADVDRLLRRDTILQPSLAVAEQAAAAALIEQYSDEACKMLEAALTKGHLRPRFSPGYADFALEEQAFILSGLDAYKRIGLTYTDAFMLTPSKSVTAVIGVVAEDSRCYASGCQTCSKINCLFRKT